MLRTPRDRFQENKAETTAHSELCNSAAFIRAVDAAMLEYIRLLPSVKDAHSSVVNSSKVEAVREFSILLMTLADPSPVRPQMPSGNLPDQIRR